MEAQKTNMSKPGDEREELDCFKWGSRPKREQGWADCKARAFSQGTEGMFPVPREVEAAKGIAEGSLGERKAGRNPLSQLSTRLSLPCTDILNVPLV